MRAERRAPALRENHDRAELDLWAPKKHCRLRGVKIESMVRVKESGSSSNSSYENAPDSPAAVARLLLFANTARELRCRGPAGQTRRAFHQWCRFFPARRRGDWRCVRSIVLPYRADQ